MYIQQSLGHSIGLIVTKKLTKYADDVGKILALVGEPGASVEDAAEATLRIYARLAKVENDYLGEDEFVVFDSGQKGSKCSSRSNRSSRWAREDLDLELNLQVVKGTELE